MLGLVFGTVVKTVCHGCPHVTLESLAHILATLHGIQLPADGILRAADDGSSIWNSAILRRNLGGIRGLWLQPGSALDIVSEELANTGGSLSLSLPFPIFQIKQEINKLLKGFLFLEAVKCYTTLRGDQMLCPRHWNY